MFHSYHPQTNGRIDGYLHSVYEHIFLDVWGNPAELENEITWLMLSITASGNITLDDIYYRRRSKMLKQEPN